MPIHPLIVSLFAIAFALLMTQKIKKAESGSGKAIEISQAIREGAKAYLKREYQTIGLVAVVLFILLWKFISFNAGAGFLVGAAFSALVGYAGMMVSTQANLKVAEAAKKGLPFALSLAFRGGAVTGLLVVGLGLLAVSGFYFLTKDLEALVALGFGGSLISVFARLGGGIYTKAADVGADLVGKLEKGIPEDDPRNPAVIADLVGDNVGDCAGMAADLFETYVVTLVAAMILGQFLFSNTLAIFLPLILASVAIFASLLSIFFVRLGKNEGIMTALYKGILGTAVLTALGFFPVIKKAAEILEKSFLRLYACSLIGIAMVAGMFFITEYFTSKKYSPVKSIAKASKTGHGTNVITGLAVGMRATILPVLLICLGILLCFSLADLYGLAIASVTMLSLAGMVVALDAYGPITDNASGIAEMAGLPDEMREVTDALDEVGNTTKAVTKTYAIASAALASSILFYAYTQEIEKQGLIVKFLLNDYRVLIGLFVGGLLPYLFGSMAMQAVGKTAGKVVEEVRRQFWEIKGLMEGEAKPEYGKCVDIVTKAAIKEMIMPALLPVIVPILAGVILGPQCLGGVLIGSLITGLFVAISMTSGGAAWDNAKKYIEQGNFNGKGSFAHQAAVTGDTVGDPYKDTVGLAINPMIKVINIVALLIARFLI
ncbi:MAG: sodium-translocating pyrophosphatase [Candidatus Nealsonbacteria bacterium CG08_land_8_20_14_0_20_43_11]|uniref:K(+)-insensitive pyrophosphate-energized proton pump n=1 Tax=Candidatus Nealsonbacteria bacterium CG08_land_8_20_14_0_20_43_11 TaxID=1974706 RepID=A0A2M6T189_9BACT|nr:MAG: sodium-translocating pyrophosphatase [Candidatus Nealsonbacteria bacterium CG08_land_8_20_14_0_20_43_11]